MAFIVYKDLENMLKNITELPQGDLNSRVVGGTVGKDNETTFSITFPTTFSITLQHNEVGAGGPRGVAGGVPGGDFPRDCTAGPVAVGASQWCELGARLRCSLR